MGTDLLAESAEARHIFVLADRISGLPITRLCAQGPLDQLTATDVAQPAVVATSLAALAVLRERVGKFEEALRGQRLLAQVGAHAYGLRGLAREQQR